MRPRASVDGEADAGCSPHGRSPLVRLRRAVLGEPLLAHPTEMIGIDAP
jgi:hypothetical protein